MRQSLTAEIVFILAVGLLCQEFPSQQAVAAERTPKQEKKETRKSTAQPLDPIELLALAVAGLDYPFTQRQIESRGIGFVPDEEFTSVLRSRAPAIADILGSTKPKRISQEDGKRKEARAFFMQAVKDAVPKNYAQSLKECSEALILLPDLSPLHAACGALLLQQAKFEEAEVKFVEATRLWPENADAHALLGLTYQARKYHEGALNEFRESLRLLPDQRVALLGVGGALCYLKDFQNAIPVLQSALAKTSQLHEAHKFLGIAYFHTNDVAGAVRELSEFVRTNPNDAETQFMLGAAHMRQGNAKSALEHCTIAMKLSSGDPVIAGACRQIPRQ